RYGYTVYDLGNREHLEHEPPEDHTPYSATGYPRRARYGVGYAIDIMPPRRGLPSLPLLGAQLLADRKAGVPGISWLKYMNWEPKGNYTGPCYQESWRPRYARRRSGDRGHIHLSGLTGFETSAIGSGYDPVARLRGEDDDMSKQAETQINSVFNGLFFGGTSMGRAVDPDGVGNRPASNSLVAKLDWVMAQLEAQQLRDEAILAAVTGQTETGQILGLVEQRVAQLRRDAGQRETALRRDLVQAVLAALPGQDPVPRDQLEAALRSVLGQLDGDDGRDDQPTGDGA
ncbi:MAG TPA: hypothetical protein VGD43_06205, partial [Micromonospora sp.]